jgi:hypothetical protein
MVAVQELMQVLLSTTDELNALDSTALPLTQYNKKGKVMAYEADIGHKTHVLINSKAELVEVWITKASVTDITPVKQGILLFCHGIVTADKGYISKDIKDNLHNKGCNFLVCPKTNQTQQFTNVEKKTYKFRTTIERVFSQLKLYYNLILEILRLL